MQRGSHSSIHKIVLQAIETYSFDEPRDLLDMSAGTGDFLQMAQHRFPKTRLTGVETAEANVKIAVKRLKGAHFYVAKADDLPLYPETVDVVVRIGSSDQDHPLVKSIREALRVLRPGGLLVIAGRYDAKQLHQSLTAEGFQVVRQARHWPSFQRITIAKKRG